MKDEFLIRHASEEECPIILEFIKKIAAYEKLSNQVQATPEDLNQAIFVDKTCNVIFAVLNQKIIGFALYFYNFSTFKGKKGLYLEDLYIDEEYRKMQYGTKVFQYLIELAKSQNCGRMEWTCLDWNQKAIDFYKSFNARPMDGWTIFRLDEKDM
ncbi:MAG: GNAT family N-acetyltransferase [Bacilli bacterium]|nr:GNAT family N-acetyltransferase [Bacilli bacterium]